MAVKSKSASFIAGRGSLGTMTFLEKRNRIAPIILRLGCPEFLRSTWLSSCFGTEKGKKEKLSPVSLFSYDRR
jgi:hypothetical protein